MSDHHSDCNYRTGGGGHRRCNCREDVCDNDKLWNDFESCAQAVARLYNDQSWRSFRGAAEGTTQLYKTSVDSFKRGFDKGFQAGCSSIAKEIMHAARNSPKIEQNLLMEVLYRNLSLGTEEAFRNMTARRQGVDADEPAAAVELFQQALDDQPAAVAAAAAQHNYTSSPTREQNNSSERLTNFLANQVQRHRKRVRSPNDTPPGNQTKRSRKF